MGTPNDPMPDSIAARPLGSSLVCDTTIARTTRKPWSEEEDSRLWQLVRKHGHDWPFVAEQLGGRNKGAVEQRHLRLRKIHDEATGKRSQAPGRHNLRWAKWEDSELLRLVSIHGPDWDKVASFMRERNRAAVKLRHHRLNQKEIKKAARLLLSLSNPQAANHHKRWTHEEDAHLMDAIAEHGPHWEKIARHFPGRNKQGLQLRYHRINHLYSRPWKKEEEGVLIRTVHSLGPKWDIISWFFDNRTTAELKLHHQHAKHEHDVADFLVSLSTSSY